MNRVVYNHVVYYKIFFGVYSEGMAYWSKRYHMLDHFYVIRQMYKPPYNPDYLMMASTRVNSFIWPNLIKELTNDYQSLYFPIDTAEVSEDQVIDFKDPADRAAFIMKNEIGFDAQIEGSSNIPWYN